MRNSLKNFFQTSHGSAFRTDIAGIRGLAVMFVTLCHFEIPGFGGGFIGPDIFFVLSGYLITGLLVKEYSKNISKRSGRGKISLSAFYLRRTRRIFPASFFVLLCVNIYARFNMNVLQLAQLKTDSLWTALLGANINFLRQATDYFAQNNAVSPLQHYWSLSVEEQFYFVWPVLFLTAASFHKLTIRGHEVAWEGRLRAVFIGLGVTSFVWMLIEFTNTPTTAYFSTFSRAWELAIGGILSLLSIESLAAKLGRTWAILRGFALVAIVGSIAIVTPSNFGYTLWIPAAATGFLLISGPVAKDDFVYRLLSVKPLTALGAISFSLYLWHWPVLVFARNLELMDSLTQRLVGVIFCICLGTLSYWLIERTFLRIPLPTLKSRPNFIGRAGLAKSRAFTTATTVLVIAGVWAVTYSSNASSGAGQVTAWVPPTSAASYAPDADTTSTPTAPVEPMTLAEFSFTQASFVSNWEAKKVEGFKLGKLPTNLQPPYESLTQLGKDLWQSCEGYLPPSNLGTQTCQAGDVHAKNHMVLLGDSHARVLWPSLLASVDLSKWSITMLAEGNCTFSDQQPVAVFDYNKHCAEHRAYTLRYVQRERPTVVVVSDSIQPRMNIETMRAGYVKSLRKISGYSDRVVIVSAVPGIDKLSDCVSRSGSMAKCKKVQFSTQSLGQAAQADVASKFADGLLDMNKVLCASSETGYSCPAIIDNKAVYVDSSHLSVPLANAIAPFFSIEWHRMGLSGAIEFQK